MSPARLRRPWCPGRRPLVALALGLALSWLLAASAPGDEVDPEVSRPAVPHPDLSSMAPAVQQQLTTARSQLDTVLSRSSGARDRAEAYGDLGQLYLAYGLDSAARACFEKAVQLDDSESRWRYFLGVIHQAAGDDAQAQVELSVVHNLRPGDLPTLLRLGEIQLRNHRLAEARRYFRLALEAHPGSAAAHWGLGRAALEESDLTAGDLTADDLEGAATWLEKALALQPRADSIHFVLARLARRRGDLEAARHHLGLRGAGSVIFYDPLMIEAQRRTVGADAALGRGGDAQMQGLFDIAIAEYRRAVEADPENPVAHESLATVLMHQGETASAIAEYRRALELEDRRPEAHYFLGFLLAREGESTEALGHLRRAAELDPAFTATRVALGDLLLRQGDPVAARKPLLEVLALDPSHVEARLSLARAWAEEGGLEQARVELDRLAGQDLERGQQARLEQYRALLRLREGEADLALTHLERAVELDPDFLEARFQLGDQWLRRGQPDRALPHLDAVIVAQPDHGGARLSLVGALLALGRAADARDQLSEGLAVRPTDGLLAFNLARLLACGPVELRDGGRSLELAEALWGSQQSFEHAETLAMALAESGRFEAAVDLQAQLVEALGSAGDPRLLARIEDNLERYRRGESCRGP